MSNKYLPQRSLSAVWHPCTQMKLHEKLPLVAIARAEGVWLYDYDGKRYLDAIGSWWVNLFGHSNNRINAAVREQLDKMEHVMLAGFTHEPVVELSERLSGLVPGRLGHCFYSSDGASATEIALKMSFQYWRNGGRPTKQVCERAERLPWRNPGRLVGYRSRAIHERLRAAATPKCAGQDP
jgi:adenosylmethionine-8-amino-7-oxononanoate aminotransferase